MIKVYTGSMGSLIPLFFIGVIVLFLSFFFWGFTKAIELLLPFLVVAAYLLIILFVFGFLPVTFIKGLRPSLCLYSLMMSNALGMVTWMVAFLYVMKVFGILGIVFAFLFQFLAPIALVGAMLKGAWHIAGHLVLWTSFAYLMKFYSQWVFNLDSGPKNKGDIIDVDALEVQNRID